MSETRLLFLYAETPVHAGADTGTGALDLPIQREITTGLPIIKAESLKGALRDHFCPPELDEQRWVAMFGSEPATSGATKRGSLRVHEAQTLAFPAPTMERTYCWVTSPLAGARLARRAALAGVDLPEMPGSRVGDTACLASGPQADTLVLGPYTVRSSRDERLMTWASRLAELALSDGDAHAYFRAKLADDLLCGSDTLLAQLSKDCCPVVPRVQLGKKDEEGNRTKTVENGPFYSEYLPGETLLVAMVEGTADDLRTLTASLDGSTLRVGGDENIGKGLMWCRLQGGA